MNISKGALAQLIREEVDKAVKNVIQQKAKDSKPKGIAVSDKDGEFEENKYGVLIRKGCAIDDAKKPAKTKPVRKATATEELPAWVEQLEGFYEDSERIESYTTEQYDDRTTNITYTTTEGRTYVKGYRQNSNGNVYCVHRHEK